MDRALRPAPRSYLAATPDFTAGKDSPTAFLARCLRELDAREPQVEAFVCYDAHNARALAEAASRRQVMPSAAANRDTSRRLRSIHSSSLPVRTTGRFSRGSICGRGSSRRSARTRGSSPANRRRTSRSAGSGPIRSSFRTSIQTFSIRARSASGNPPTAVTRGNRSAAI